ncbi:hypothetical protein FC90_GL000303 [Latilactobacillus graminis DSM 20719]|uniref:Uncharacterized protein n=1 Tax=Latilactobacillus graminis DSM 20719 TaxID=1423752 RepID=A0AA89I1G4_9LACO|nr:hypothetical protein FC90_GL000303 [Latilactobacillus graminis DSM 20719]
MGLLAPTTTPARHPAVAERLQTPSSKPAVQDQVQNHKLKCTTWSLNTPTLQVQKRKEPEAGSF